MIAEILSLAFYSRLGIYLAQSVYYFNELLYSFKTTMHLLDLFWFLLFNLIFYEICRAQIFKNGRFYSLKFADLVSLNFVLSYFPISSGVYPGVQ